MPPRAMLRERATHTRRTWTLAASHSLPVGLAGGAVSFWLHWASSPRPRPSTHWFRIQPSARGLRLGRRRLRAGRRRRARVQPTGIGRRWALPKRPRDTRRGRAYRPQRGPLRTDRVLSLHEHSSGPASRTPPSTRSSSSDAGEKRSNGSPQNRDWSCRCTGSTRAADTALRPGSTRGGSRRLLGRGPGCATECQSSEVPG